MISRSDLIDLFRKALSEKWGYIYGKAGQLWTQEQQNAATREQTVKNGQKWVGRYVADCSGMFTWAFKKLGGYMYHGSNTMYKKYTTARGKLVSGKRSDGKELLPGTAVFKVQNGDDYYHVGLYVGDGVVIEAQGTSSGVVTSKITSWHCWGELKGVDYTSAAVPDIQPVPVEKPQESTAETVYTVVAKDTLWKIAQKFYGAGKKYTLIMEANNLTSDNIRVGAKLIIPKA